MNGGVAATKSRLARAAAAAAGAVVLLAGCASGTHPGAAASVGDTEISLGRLDDVVTAVTKAQGQPISPTSALQLMINAELSRQVAEQRSVSVSDAEVASAVKQVIPDAALLDKFEKDPVANDFLRDFTRGQIDLVKIGGASGITDPAAREAAQKGARIITEAAGTIGVDVNPRYGRWTGDKIDATSGSLSTPFQQAANQAQNTGEQPPQ